MVPPSWSNFFPYTQYPTKIIHFCIPEQNQDLTTDRVICETSVAYFLEDAEDPQVVDQEPKFSYREIVERAQQYIGKGEYDLKSKNCEHFASWCYLAQHIRNSIPMHSMVLIGARKTTSGDYFFLLQNWWEGRYFIEVSGEYLHHCQAEITFVKKAITRKRELATLLCDALYAETSADASETFYEYEGKIAGENVF